MSPLFTLELLLLNLIWLIPQEGPLCADIISSSVFCCCWGVKATGALCELKQRPTRAWKSMYVISLPSSQPGGNSSWVLMASQSAGTWTPQWVKAVLLASCTATMELWHLMFKSGQTFFSSQNYTPGAFMWTSVPLKSVCVCVCLVF